jgi:DNA-binding protein YbaB
LNVGALNAKMTAMQNKINQLEEALKNKSNWWHSLSVAALNDT